MNIRLTSHSCQDTVRLGILLGNLLVPGSVVGLIGELGTGKTCFIKGLAYSIQRIPVSEVTSPTFTILQEYKGNIPFYHFDAYRLSGVGDLETIGFEDYIDGEGITVIEWADKICDALPKDCLLIYIELVNENERCFTLKASGRQYLKVLEKFCATIGESWNYESNTNI